MLVTATTLCVLVKAVIIQPPVNQSAFLGTTATFSCTADGVQVVTYLVNNMTIAEVASIGVTLSEQVISGSQITSYLHIPVMKDTINFSVVCVACVRGGTRFNSLPAYLQGLFVSVQTRELNWFGVQ